MKGTDNYVTDKETVASILGVIFLKMCSQNVYILTPTLERKCRIRGPFRFLL
jgi:hypothetical protein